MRSLCPLLFAIVLAAGCGDFLPVAACGTCNGVASKHDAVAGCCGRGCVISDSKCMSGFRYVSGSSQSLIDCAEPDECFSPDLSASAQDLSLTD